MGLIHRWKRRYWRRDDLAIAALKGASPAIVVTGGSDGIGLALAKVFARSDTIVLIARDQSGLDRARSELAGLGHNKVLTLSQDICASDAPEAIRQFLESHDLYADIFVNSAGIGVSGDFAADTAERLTALTEINITALTRLCRAFLPDMLARGRGGIINVSSLGGFVPGPYQAAYYASKAYVISLTRALAHETRGQGVRISTSAPGPVNTEFHARAGAQSALYRHILPALSPDQVARSTYRGYQWGHTLIIPGLFNNLIGFAMRVLPAMVTVPIVSILLKPRSWN